MSLFLSEMHRGEMTGVWHIRLIDYIAVSVYFSIPKYKKCIVDPHYLWIQYLITCHNILVTPGTLLSFTDLHNVEKFEFLNSILSQLGVNKMMLCYFDSALISMVSMLFSAMFTTFLCFLLMILLLKILPKCIVEALASIPKCNKVVRCIMEKYIYIYIYIYAK